MKLILFFTLIFCFTSHAAEKDKIKKYKIGGSINIKDGSKGTVIGVSDRICHPVRTITVDQYDSLVATGTVADLMNTLYKCSEFKYIFRRPNGEIDRVVETAIKSKE